MRPYEVAFIIHPDLDDSAFKEVLDRVQAWIKDAGGKVTKVDHWGKKKMAYEIRKQKEGQYVILQAEMEPSFCTELERNMRFQESVMRFMITRPPELADEESASSVSSAAAAVAEAVEEDEEEIEDSDGE
ncbi:MAG: 30S ribosomal protein S6 [Anaerolineae bacterium]|nr:30S ribosomal protein S6 [Anaerolineae bacterium]